MKKMDNKAWRGLENLWDPQVGALTILEKYLDSGSTKAALIHMPTGTGKTGVVAIVAQCMPRVRHALLLTPWITLARQLRDDVSVDEEKSAFWSKVRPNKSVANKPVVQVWPSILKAESHEKLVVHSTKKQGGVHELVRAKRRPEILVSTIQALQWLHRHRKSRPEYDRLQQLISLVVVDEGHYEPAPDWADAVRDLEKPTVLFTATPYRNDLKLFDLDDSSIYSFTYHAAVAQRYIRKVQFYEGPVAVSDRKMFAAQLVEFFNGDFQKRKPHPKPKVIVRCRTEESVKQIAKLLHGTHKQKVIGIHENFKSTTGEPYLVKSAPDPRTNEDLVFWVHQFKLMEGLDDSAFSLLAIFEGFGNSRALVQQVGRVIRNPGQHSGRSAYVFADPRSDQFERWKNYESFEKQCDDDPDYLISLRQKPVQQRILEVQPQIGYFLRDFRPAFDPNATHLETEFLFRLSTNVYELRRGFKAKKLEAALRKLYRDEDRAGRDRPLRPTPGVLFWTFVACQNSPMLRNMAFIEGRLGYTIYRIIGRLLFYYDTHGGVPEYLTTNATSVTGQRLQRLFENREGNRLVELSLSNTDTGVHSVRSRSIRARDLGATAPGISDHAHYLSTASGYVQDGQGRRSRRYVGFSRGRITELSVGRCRYDEYLNWLEYIAEEIRKTTTSPLITFDRYAEFAHVPKDTAPRNILLDVEDVKTRYAKVNVEGSESPITLDFDDACLDVDNGTFQLVANGTPYTVKIKYDKQRDRYELYAPELAEAYLDQEDAKHSLVAYLNINQTFRVVPASKGYIYAHFNWYRPRLAIIGARDTARIDFLSLFHPIAGLESIESEFGIEGRPPRDNAWQENCLFDLIDTLGGKTALAAHMEEIDILVCDDKLGEIADFIAANTKKPSVCFIHAKAHRQQRIRSTSAFGVVCSQAVKNLEFLQPYNNKFPPNLAKWTDKKHPWRDGKVRGEVKRVRLPKGKAGTVVWSMISQAVRNPSASREVWLLLGKGFSKGEFEKRLRNNDPTAQDIQLIYLIQSTWNAIASIGAQLRIFCSP